MSEKTLEPARHEASDFPKVFIWRGSAVLVMSVAALAGAVLLLFPESLKDQVIHMPLPEYPAPRLQVNPSADFHAFKEHDRSRLASGSIQKAIRELAESSIADWPSGPNYSATESPSPVIKEESREAHRDTAYRAPRARVGAPANSSRVARSSERRLHTKNRRAHPWRHHSAQ